MSQPFSNSQCEADCQFVISILILSSLLYQLLSTTPCCTPGCLERHDHSFISTEKVMYFFYLLLWIFKKSRKVYSGCEHDDVTVPGVLIEQCEDIKKKKYLLCKQKHTMQFPKIHAEHEPHTLYWAVSRYLHLIHGNTQLCTEPLGTQSLFFLYLRTTVIFHCGWHFKSYLHQSLKFTHQVPPLLVQIMWQFV